jgi:hypothetical protein
MSEAAMDPYTVLGVAPEISDIELRRVYRGLVKRHHPDHNGGSAESAARFAQIQNAYAQIAHNRQPPQPSSSQPSQKQQPPQPSYKPPPSRPARSAQPAQDAGIEDRIASLEREMAAMREAEGRRAQEQAQFERRRATPEELGYYTTDDSFTKIIDDAADEFSERLRRSDSKKQFARRLSDLFSRDD